MGAALGSLVPIPGFYWVAALVGSVFGGVWGTKGGLLKGFRGALGVAAGTVAAVLIDLLCVLGIGAVIALWDLSQAVQ